MPYDASALAREGRLARHDHHWNPPKSLANHVFAKQEGCQCPRSSQPWRKFYSLQIATDVPDPKHCDQKGSKLHVSLHLAKAVLVFNSQLLFRCLWELKSSPPGNSSNSWYCLELCRSKDQGWATILSPLQCRPSKSLLSNLGELVMLQVSTFPSWRAP